VEYCGRSLASLRLALRLAARSGSRKLEPAFGRDRSVFIAVLSSFGPWGPSIVEYCGRSLASLRLALRLAARSGSRKLEPAFGRDRNH
ncbi:hypothetical protein, partial [Actinomadura luteofluorescens]